MKDFNSIFLDTAPIIYYLQNSEQYYYRMKQFWQKYEDCDYITSTVTVAEYLTYPYQNKNSELVRNFYFFLEEMDIDIKSIDRAVAEKAAKIRADYKHFKMMDALQLAAACLTGCDMFLTNDKQLRQFKEIKCITVEELE